MTDPFDPILNELTPLEVKDCSPGTTLYHAQTGIQVVLVSNNWQSRTSRVRFPKGSEITIFWGNLKLEPLH